MRFRPLGVHGQAISALTLNLGPADLKRGPEAARDKVHAALEAGINSYRLETADPLLAEVLGQGLKHVDRKLLMISIVLGNSAGPKGPVRDFSAQGMTAAIDKTLILSGLQHFDLAMLDEPGEDELPQSSLTALKGLRATGRVKLLGIQGDGEVMDTYVSTGAFDVLTTPYHVYSPWRIRTRLRTAREKDMAIFVEGHFPAELDTAKKAAAVNKPKRGLFGLIRSDRRKHREPLAGAGTFAFLHRTENWTAEQICLAYSLSEPSIATVIIRAEDIDRLNHLAEVPDLDMPAGLPAQIEMARIGAVQAA